MLGCIDRLLDQRGEIPVWLGDCAESSLERPPTLTLGSRCGTVSAHLLLGLGELGDDARQCRKGEAACSTASLTLAWEPTSITRRDTPSRSTFACLTTAVTSHATIRRAASYPRSLSAAAAWPSAAPRRLRSPPWPPAPPIVRTSSSLPGKRHDPQAAALRRQLDRRAICGRAQSWMARFRVLQHYADHRVVL